MAVHRTYESILPDHYALGKNRCVPLFDIDDEIPYAMWTRDPELLRVADAAGNIAAKLTIMIVEINSAPNQAEIEFEPFSLVTRKALGIFKRVADLNGLVYEDPHMAKSEEHLGYITNAPAGISIVHGMQVEQVPLLVPYHGIEPQTRHLIGV